MEIIAKSLPIRDSSNVELTISVSKAKTFDDCKAKYKFCYIEKLPRISRDFHIFGMFLHKILESFHLILLEDDLKKDNWKDELNTAWDSSYIEYHNQITEEQCTEAKLIINQYRDIIIKDGLPNVIGVEKPFYININDKLLLNGFIDRIQLDPDGVIHVADYKTTKDKRYLKDFFQLITYCYALMLEDTSIKHIRASFILLRHNFKYITKEFSRDEVKIVAEKFLQYQTNIADEKLWRPNPQFLCKYCDYLEFCASGKNYLNKKNLIKKSKPVVGIRKW